MTKTMAGAIDSIPITLARVVLMLGETLMKLECRTPTFHWVLIALPTNLNFGTWRRRGGERRGRKTSRMHRRCSRGLMSSKENRSVHLSRKADLAKGPKIGTLKKVRTQK